MDDAEIDARAARLEVLQRREERVLDVGQHRNVDPVDAAAGGLDGGVGEIDGRRKIGRRKARPAAERAEAEVIAELDSLRDARRQDAELRDVALDGAVGGIARHRAVGVLHFGGAVPLDGEIVVRDVLDDGVDLGGERFGEAGPDLVAVAWCSGKSAAAARC